MNRIKRREGQKKQFIVSIFCLLMCIAMFIGSTFAWFTDTASTSVNKIQAGTLNVTLEKATAWDTTTGEPTEWEDAEDKTLNFLQTNGESKKESTGTIYWEPGATYELPQLKISNEGNLALKYKVVISGINGSEKLNKAITWTINIGNKTYEVNGEHKLSAKTTTTTDFDILTIKGHMNENAGNEYQGLSIDGIAVTVVATQDNVEFDSTTQDYDKDAVLPVYAKAVGNLVVSKGTDTSATITTTGDIQTISGGDMTVSYPAGVKLSASDYTEGSDNVKKSSATQELKYVNDAPSASMDEQSVSIVSSQAVAQYDLSLPVADSNTVLVTATIQYTKDLAGVEIYHSGVLLPSAQSSDGEEYATYDSSKGIITLHLKHASPIDIVYDKPGMITVSTCEELVEAVKGDKDIYLKNDIVIDSNNKAIEIKKDVTIYGNGNKLSTAANSYEGTNDGRVINIESNTDPVTLTLKDVNISGPTINGYNRGITAWGNSDITIVMDNCIVSANHYALNIAGSNTKSKVVVRNSTLTGYAAFQTWSANSNATFENCTLIGINQWSGDDDDFETIVINKDASGSNLTFKNCVIKAVEQGSANEYLLCFRTSDATVTFDNCNFFKNGEAVSLDKIGDQIDNDEGGKVVIK